MKRMHSIFDRRFVEGLEKTFSFDFRGYFRLHRYNFLQQIVLISFNYFSKVLFIGSSSVRRWKAVVCLGIPFVCRTTHLEKLKNPSQQTSRRSYRQIPNGNTTENGDSKNVTDADLLSKVMTGFSEVVW